LDLIIDHNVVCANKKQFEPHWTVEFDCLSAVEVKKFKPLHLCDDLKGKIPQSLTHIASFMQKQVVIIGNGITGITTARHLRKNSDCRITVISSESEYFFSRTALMYVYMGHMKVEHTQPYEPWFWKKNRIELVYDHVESIDPKTSCIRLNKGGKLSFDQLVIATGSKPSFFNWPGQDSKGVQGLYGLQDLENLEKNTHPYNAKPSERKVKRAVIVGGGLIGVELAEMLLTRGIEVTFLIRENKFWGSVLPKEEASLVARHMVKHHIDMRFSTEMKEILADHQGRVRAIVTTSGEEVGCQLVGVTTGVSPNISLLKDSGIEVKRGVLVDSYLETNIPGIYAAGDCAEFREAPPGRKNIEQVWYTGRMWAKHWPKLCQVQKPNTHPDIGSIVPNSSISNTRLMVGLVPISTKMKTSFIGSTLMVKNVSR
jgi:NAD(P)H-nitrite reductase large subunit